MDGIQESQPHDAEKPTNIVDLLQDSLCRFTLHTCLGFREVQKCDSEERKAVPDPEHVSKSLQERSHAYRQIQMPHLHVWYVESNWAYSK
jgi:hypothetical protein